jgi:hypothetical protein
LIGGSIDARGHERPDDRPEKVITPQRLAQRLAQGDSFLREVVGTGKLMFAM